MEENLYYHASELIFKIGREYSVEDFDCQFTRDHLKRDKSQQLVNIRIDEKRPIDIKESRLKAIYLFKKLSHCQYYARSLNKQVYIYKVKPKSVVSGGFPFCLLNKIYKAPDEKSRELLIDEYWQPKFGKWKYLEFLTLAIEIVDIIEGTSIAGCDDYLDDLQLVNKITK